MRRKALGKGLEALIHETVESSPVHGRAVITVDIKRIRSNPHQPRRHFSEKALDELRRSIEEKGLIQPIVVCSNVGGEETYQLVVGERRLRAAKLAGLKEIPCVVMDIETDEELLEVALIENIQRENLNPIDEAQAYKALIEKFGITQEEISIRVGKNRTTIANFIRLLGLSSRIKEMIAEGVLNAGSARALLSLEDPGLREKLAERIVKEGMSVRTVEKLVKKMNCASPKLPVQKRTDPIIERLCEEMREYLGTAVSIKHGKKKGRIEIEFYTDDDLERLIHLIRGLNPEDILDPEIP